MKIGGLQPVTLLDYPQKVAAIVFTSGCNMRCPFCHNPSLVVPRMIRRNKPIAETEVLDFLNQRKKYLDGVVITGGEPAIQPDIADFCRKLKDMGYEIKFDTNGLVPEVINDLIGQGLVDYLAMDIKAPLDSYHKLAGVKCNIDDIGRSIGLIMASELPYEFRTTLIRGWHDEDGVRSMAELIQGANKYFLQNFFQPPHGLVNKKFKGQPFNQEEMEGFVKIAREYVTECGLR